MSPKLGFLLALAFLALFRSAWKWQIVKWSSRDKSGKIGDEINLFAWRNTYFIATVSKNIDICRDVLFLLFLFSRINVWYNFFLRNFSINSNFRKRLSLNMIYYSIYYSLLVVYYESIIRRGRYLRIIFMENDQSKQIIESSLWILGLINLYVFIKI